MSRFFKTWGPFLLILGGLVLLPQVVHNRYFLHITVMAGIYNILTLSWNLLAGYTGQLNLGHAAFYGIGAYTSALLAMKTGLSPWLGLPAGGLAAAFFGSTIITPGRFNAVGSLIAVYFLAFGISGLTIHGIEPFVQNLFYGAALVLAVTFSTLVKKHGGGQ